MGKRQVPRALLGALAAAMVPAVPAPSAGAQSATPPAARDARPKPRAPFTEIRWEQDSPVAQIEGRWMAIRAIDGRPVAEILEWCRSRHGDRWQRRFEEDLDEVMTGMGQPLSDRVSLEVVDVETGATMTLTGVSMSEDNRRLLMQRKREREQRAAAAPDEVNRINRIHGAEIDARFAPLTQRLMAPGAELLTPAEAGADLDQLEWEIENAYAYATRLGVDYRAALDSIRWALDKGISRGDLALQIDQLMALFGDGHSRARLEEIPEGSLPVLLAGGPNGEIVALGAEGHGLLDPAHPMLVAIDDHPVELWRAAAQRLVTQGSPGLQRHEEVRWLGRIQLLRALMKRSARESVRITLASMDGASLRSVELPLQSSPQRRPRQEAISWRVLESGIGYLRIAAMNDDAPFLVDLRRALESTASLKGLIIDVRDNGGGSREAMRVVAGALAKPGDAPRVVNIAAYRLRPGEEPLRAEGYLSNRMLYPRTSATWSDRHRAVIDEAATVFNPEWALPEGAFSAWHYAIVEHENSRDAISCPVIVLLNEGCFSATDIFLGALKGMRGVTLMGAPSGGGSGRVRRTRLAHSGIEVHLSTMVSFTPDGLLFDGRGVEPDVRHESTIDDLAGLTDSLRDAAVRRIAGK